MEFADDDDEVGTLLSFRRRDSLQSAFGRGWTPMSSDTRRPWQEISHPAFVEGHGRMIWRPIGPAIIFPKSSSSWEPVTLNYP